MRQPKYSYLVSSARAAPAPYRDSSYNTEQRKAVTSYPTTSSYQVTGQGQSQYFRLYLLSSGEPYLELKRVKSSK